MMKSGDIPLSAINNHSFDETPQAESVYAQSLCVGMQYKRILGGSVCGAAHVQQDKPCQDALLLYKDTSGRFVIACVADGHGSDRCPLSEEGARAATEAGRDLMLSILSEGGEPKDSREMFERFNAQKEIRIPKQLEALWKARVKEIHIQNGREAGEDFPYLLYGTTLLALAVTDDFVFAAQIGDGDMLMIDPDGEPKRLFPAAEQTTGETFSLCMENSWKYVSTQIMPLPEERPLMFLLSSDGYANSFTETAGFMKAGTDIYSIWREQGEEYICENISDWLTQSSEIGSGDDITVALVVCGAAAD